MIETNPIDTSTVLNEIRSRILDECSVCTFKSLGKQLGISYDLSKQLLFQYQQQEKDAVDASFLLSGLRKDDCTHVVKVVDAAKLEESKALLSRIDSLHVYSLSPKGVVTPENVVEVDLAQNREALGTTLNADYASLGRVSLVSAPGRRAAGAGRRRPDVAPPKPAETSKSKESKDVHEHRKTIETKPAPMCVEQTDQKRKTSVPGEVSFEAKNKRARMIDSDSDDEGTNTNEAVKMKTYINDKGEEVTEIQPTTVKTERPPKADAKEKKSAGPKKPSGGKQKGIMGFFKPK